MNHLTKVPESGFIFISYQHNDFTFASELANDLKNTGIEVWMDKADSGIKIGDNWPESIQDALDRCKAIIPVLTSDYLKSGPCQDELTRVAGRNGVPVFPVIRSEIIKEDWPLVIQRKQGITFIRSENYHKSLKTLADCIKIVFSAGAQIRPEEEIVYLKSLLAELESRRGVLEYIDLEIEGRKFKGFNKSQPEDEWGFSYLKKKEAKSKDSKENKESYEKIPLNGIKDAIEKFQQFVLIGDPGCGKTTTLRKLALEAVKNRISDRSSFLLPFLLNLSEWENYQTIDESGLSYKTICWVKN